MPKCPGDLGAYVPGARAAREAYVPPLGSCGSDKPLRRAEEGIGPGGRDSAAAGLGCVRPLSQGIGRARVDEESAPSSMVRKLACSRRLGSFNV